MKEGGAQGETAHVQGEGAGDVTVTPYVTTVPRTMAVWVIGDGPRPGSVAGIPPGIAAGTGARPTGIEPGAAAPRPAYAVLPAKSCAPVAGAPALVPSQPGSVAFLSTKPAAATSGSMLGGAQAAGAKPDATNGSCGATGAATANAAATSTAPRSASASAASAPRTATAGRLAIVRPGSAANKPKAAGFKPGGGSARKAPSAHGGAT